MYSKIRKGIEQNLDSRTSLEGSSEDEDEDIPATVDPNAEQEIEGDFE